MTSGILFFSIFGALIPDIIRILQLIREGNLEKLKPAEFLISAVISILLGLTAVWLSEVTSSKHAVLVAAAAPAVLTKLIGAVIGPPNAQRGFRNGEARYLIDWWRL